jgi:putative membrane-bound dehydrogenase-like protein
MIFPPAVDCDGLSCLRISPMLRSVLAGLLLGSVGLLVSAAMADDPPESAIPQKVKNRDVLPENVAGNAEVERIMKSFEGRGAVGDDSDPTPAAEAVKLFETAEGLTMDLIAAEPAVEQPLFIHFDDRGRMWVVQYRQYPYPEGLKVVRYDQHLRAVFDKVPQPPPHGAKGKDKITVFEDTDGDGEYDSHKDVVTGLNIVSSVATGPGSDGRHGIWVLNPPYLLFYPDADRDDIPDGDPEVHLAGFGLEDTHSVANSLMWGPDGWLYAANGSTTTGNVSSAVTKNVRWEGQNIWRYHPSTKVFEIYAEGGGNTFSAEIDGEGRNFSGTNHGNTRGMYYAQGSYGSKNWGKHGPLTNPYAFGWFEHMEHEGDQDRFPQTFVIYEGGSLPAEYHRNVIAANALHNRVWASELISDGSTYRTVDKPPIVTTPDQWFRPVCVMVGPDGGVYIADWYDTRLTHVDPRDNWHKTSGRVYRLGPEESGVRGQESGDWPRDIASLSDDQLIALFDHPNKFQRQTASRVLGWRLAGAEGTANPQAGATVAQLKELALADDAKALEALWSLHLAGALDLDLVAKLLDHPDENVRRWTIRLLGDHRRLSDALAEQLVALATSEPYVQVRSQLASSAKRFDTPYAVPIIRELLQRDEDAGDKHVPLLLWWALEQHAGGGREAVLSMLEDKALWDVPLVREMILPRLMKRFALEDQVPPLPANPHLGMPLARGRSTGFQPVPKQDDQAGTHGLKTRATPESPAMSGLDACAKLLALAPSAEHSSRLMTGFLEAYQGREIAELPPELSRALDEYQQSLGTSDLALALRRGNDDAVAEALKVVRDESADAALRLSYIAILGQISKPQVVSSLLSLLGSNSPAIKRAVMQSLMNYDDPQIGQAICSRYQSTLPAEHGLRDTAHQVLASRAVWTKQFLEEIAANRIKLQTIPLDIVQQMRLHDDPQIQKTLDELWGRTRNTPEEKIAQIERLQALLASSGRRPADSLSSQGADAPRSPDGLRGGELFKKHCGVCHTLFDDGGQTGPNLTGYERSNLEFLLLAIVDPSAAIREEFTNYQVVTIDGRVLTGLIDEQTATTVTLRGANNQQTLLNRDDIDVLQATPASIMPDGLVEKLTDSELRDLFAYLMARTPPAE